MLRKAGMAHRQRFYVFAVVVAFHAILLGLLLSYHATRIAKPENFGAVALIKVSSQTSSSPPSRPKLPSVLDKESKSFLAETAQVEVERSAIGSGSLACSVNVDLLRDLLADKLVVDAVRHSPVEARSVAQAVVMWNVEWSHHSMDPVSPLGLVRAAVEKSLSKSSGPCLDEAVTGPRLLPIPDATGDGSIILVFGSGVWNWHSLLLPEALKNLESTDVLPPSSAVLPNPQEAGT